MATCLGLCRQLPGAERRAVGQGHYVTVYVEDGQHKIIEA